MTKWWNGSSAIPLSDGGTFTGVADIVSKYGLVPKEVIARDEQQ